MSLTFTSNPIGNKMEVVSAGSVTVVNNGSALTTTTVAHGLGFKPFMISTLDNSTVSGISSRVLVFLPTYLQAGIDTGTPTINFQIWIYGVADEDNLYFQMINSTGVATSITVSYYLLRQGAG